MTHPKDLLRAYVHRYVSLTDSAFDLFFERLSERAFSKKSTLLREGEVCRHYHFLLEGLVRTFYLDEDGNERITQFGIERWWVTDLESLVNETPARVTIQALESTTVLSISLADLESLYQEVPKMERFFRKVTEKMYIALHNKHEFYLQEDGQTKYFNLLQQIPGFVQRVPQYMLASYLQVSPEHLSYIRKKATDKR